MRSKLKMSNLKAVFFFLFPSLAGILFFSMVPILTSLMLSLTQWNGLKKINLFGGLSDFLKEEFIGAANFINILAGEEFWRVLRNTCYFIILYIPLILIASIIVATLLNTDIKGITGYRVLYYIPVLTSWVAGALIWKWVLSPEYGAVNDILRLIGIEGPGWLQDKNWAMPGIVLASIWKDAGFFGLILLGGMQGINPTYYEAAEIDGARWWKRLTAITLPLLSPVTFFIIIICIINSFQLFPQVMVMTADAGPHGATQVIVERIYKYAFKYFKMGYAAAFSWILFAIIFFFTLIQMKLQERWVHYDS